MGMLNKNTLVHSEKNVELFNWLKNQPTLVSALEKIRTNIASEESPQKLDDVEALLIEQVRSLGNAFLTHWAENQKPKAMAVYENEKKIRSHSKKNSISQRVMEE